MSQTTQVIHMSDVPFCQRCKEDFPVIEARSGFRMGNLTRLEHIPKRLWTKLRLVEWENENGRYLCGNCYFDLTDE